MDLAALPSPPAAGVRTLVPHVPRTASGQAGAVPASAGARDRNGASPGHQVTTPVTHLPSPADRQTVPAHDAGDLEGPRAEPSRAQEHPGR
jgi:hypothetical protein